MLFFFLRTVNYSNHIFCRNIYLSTNLCKAHMYTQKINLKEIEEKFNHFLIHVL